MTPRETLVVFGWLVRDTFRQSMASRLFWALLGLSTVTIICCAGARVENAVPLTRVGENPEFLPPTDVEASKAKEKGSGVDVIGGRLTLAFGAIRVPLGRDDRDAVHFLELLLAGGVADTIGLLLTLIWTAGFLPTFLDERNVTVLLAKPTPRWAMLMGKYVGALAFVATQAGVFVLGTWLALGLSTGVWDRAYLWSLPILVVHFAIFFSFSALVAVATRSTVASVFGSIAFWFLCWGMNFGRHTLVAMSHGSSDGSVSPGLLRLVEIGYWTLPKPADLGMLLFDALGAETYFGQQAAWTTIKAHGEFQPGLSLALSLTFTAFVLVAASREFETTDY